MKQFLNPHNRRFHGNAFSRLFCFVCALAFSIVLAAQTGTASGQLQYIPRGTGQTTGHILTLSVYNPTATPLQTTVGACFIPSTQGYQGYVVLQTYAVEVPAFGSRQVFLEGYCTNVARPAVPEGEHMADVAQWVSWASGLPLPTPGAQLDDAFLPIPPSPSDDVLRLTFPGTQEPFPYRIDCNRHPRATARLLLHAAAAAEQAFDQLIRDGMLLPARWGRSAAEVRKQIVQQVLWAYTARLEGFRYGKQEFSRQFTEEAEQLLNQEQQNFPTEAQQQVDRQTQDIWSGISLVGTSAKLIAVDKARAETIFEETPSGPAGNPVDLLPQRIQNIDPKDANADQQLIPILLFLQKNSLPESQSPLRQQTLEKWATFLHTTLDRLQPEHSISLSEILTLAGILHGTAGNALPENELETLNGLLQLRLEAHLEQQLKALSAAKPDYLQLWRKLKSMQNTDWYSRLARSKPLKKLPRLAKCRPAAYKLNPADIQLANAQWKHHFLPAANAKTRKLAWWVPASIPVAGGIVYLLLRNKDSGQPPAPPIALPDALNLPCNGDGTINVLANDSGEGLTVSAVTSSPGVSATIVSASSILVTSMGIGDFNLSYVITDIAGRTAVGSIQVQVRDLAAPVINCPPAVTLEGCDQTPAPAQTGQATASDNCDLAPAVSYLDELSGTACARMIRRTWTATDAANNSASCEQQIAVQDQSPPVFTNCPAAVMVDFGQQTDLSITGQASATDACTVPVTPSYSDDNSGISNCTGTILRTWIVADACANSAVCTQTIAVMDGSDPVFTLCPATVTVNCGQQLDLNTTGQATATDNCAGTLNPVFSDDLGGFNGCSGVIVRNWTVSDPAGNSAACTQEIAVADQTAPVFGICPGDITVTLGQQNDLNVTGLAEATDECAPDVTLLFSDDLSGFSTCGGTIGRMWTAEDACSNSAQCFQTITVVDPEPPVFSFCPPAITVACGQQDDLDITGQAKASDACAGPVQPSYSDEPAVFSGCSGEILRSWTAVDPGGNVAVCEQTITVLDQEPPVFSPCPAAIKVACGDHNNLGITGMAAATDACNGATSPSFTDDLSGFSGCQGIILRNWTSADSCGNVADCQQEITVFDEVPPVFSFCPPGLFVTCGQENNLNITGVATAEDACTGAATVNFSDDLSQFSACEGLIIRSWTAVDLCGNVANCEQAITVVAVPCGFEPNFLVGEATCGNCTGAITVEVLPPGAYTFSWSNGLSGPSLTGLCPANYSVSIHDQINSCTEIFPVTVPNVPLLSLEILAVMHPSSPTSNDGSITVQVLPATASLPISVFVNGVSIGLSGGTTFEITNLPAGTYTIHVEDATGCMSEVISVELLPGVPPPANPAISILGNQVLPISGWPQNSSNKLVSGLPEHAHSQVIWGAPGIGLSLQIGLQHGWQVRWEHTRLSGLWSTLDLATAGNTQLATPIPVELIQHTVSLRRETNFKQNLVSFKAGGVSYTRFRSFLGLPSAAATDMWQLLLGGGLGHPLGQGFRLEWSGYLYVGAVEKSLRVQSVFQVQLKRSFGKK